MRGDDGVSDEVQDHPGLLAPQAAVDQDLARLSHGSSEELVGPRHPHDDPGQPGVALQHRPDGLGVGPHRIGPAPPSARSLHLGGDPLQAGGQQILARGDRAVQPGDRHPQVLGHRREREVRDADPEGGIDDVVARESRSRSGRSAQSRRSCHGSTVMVRGGRCPSFSGESKVDLTKF